jgi:hypothetical protein
LKGLFSILEDKNPKASFRVLIAEEFSGYNVLTRPKGAKKLPSIKPMIKNKAAIRGKIS